MANATCQLALDEGLPGELTRPFLGVSVRIVPGEMGLWCEQIKWERFILSVDRNHPIS